MLHEIHGNILSKMGSEEDYDKAFFFFFLISSLNKMGGNVILTQFIFCSV